MQYSDKHSLLLSPSHINIYAHTRTHTHTHLLPTFMVSSLLHVLGCLSSGVDHLLLPIYCFYPQLCSILLVVFTPMPKQTPIRELCIRLFTSCWHSLCHIQLEFSLLSFAPLSTLKTSKHPQIPEKWSKVL